MKPALYDLNSLHADIGNQVEVIWTISDALTEFPRPEDRPGECRELGKIEGCAHVAMTMGDLIVQRIDDNFKAIGTTGTH
jgi:hypothetical protein